MPSTMLLVRDEAQKRHHEHCGRIKQPQNRLRQPITPPIGAKNPKFLKRISDLLRYVRPSRARGKSDGITIITDKNHGYLRKSDTLVDNHNKQNSHEK